MKLVVKEIIQETKDTITICFKNNSFFNKIKYLPGQFLTLHVPIEGTIHKRAYSFSSNPFTDKDLKITIKRVQKGLISNYLHDNLKIGDKLTIDKPTGGFYNTPNKKTEKQYVFFAGGSGITPIYSIIKGIIYKEPNSKILLIYANQHIETIIFINELKKLVSEFGNRLNIEHIVSKECPKLPFYNPGLVTDELIVSFFKKYHLKFDEHIYMICGPFGYMEAVKSILNVNGIPLNNIKVEVFKSPKVVINNNKLISKVEIKMNGESYKLEMNGNRSILQAAMAKNIDIPYSCRSGMCSSCKASCLEGNVKMTEGHLLAKEEVDQGKILTCISYPTGENVVIAI